VDLYAGTGLLTSRPRIRQLIARDAPLHEALDAVTTTLEWHIPGGRCSMLLLDAQRGPAAARLGAQPPRGSRDAINGMRVGCRPGLVRHRGPRPRAVIAVDVATDARREKLRHLAPNCSSGSRASCDPITCVRFTPPRGD
jgi:hypothetical protein